MYIFINNPFIKWHFLYLSSPPLQEENNGWRWLGDPISVSKYTLVRISSWIVASWTHISMCGLCFNLVCHVLNMQYEICNSFMYGDVRYLPGKLVYEDLGMVVCLQICMHPILAEEVPKQGGVVRCLSALHTALLHYTENTTLYCLGYTLNTFGHCIYRL